MPNAWFADQYNNILMGSAGFGPAWADLVHTGINNALFTQSIVGALTLGASKDDPVGHTASLPFWTGWSPSSQGITITADTGWPGGVYAQYAFTGLGTVGLTSDTFAVMPGSQITLQTMQAYSVPAGTTLSFIYTYYFYTIALAFISSASQTVVKTGADTLAIGPRILNPTIVPSNARFARVEVVAQETVLHNNATYFNLGSAAYLMQWSFGNYINDLSVGGTLSVVGTLNASGNSNLVGPGKNLGFFGGVGAVKPTIVGAKGGNVALANLLAALVNFGLLTDATT